MADQHLVAVVAKPLDAWPAHSERLVRYAVRRRERHDFAGHVAEVSDVGHPATSREMRLARAGTRYRYFNRYFYNVSTTNFDIWRNMSKFN